MTTDEFQAWYDRLGLNQAALAGRLGVDQGTISRWLNGDRAVPPFLWRALEHLETELKRGYTRRANKRRSAARRGEGAE